MNLDRRKKAEKEIRRRWGDVISRLEIRSQKLNREFNIESLSFEDDLKADSIRMGDFRYDLQRSLKINIDLDQYDDLIYSGLTIGKLFDLLDSI